MKIKHLLLLLLMFVGVSAKAQEWIWVGETPTNGGDFYIYHPETQKFLNHKKQAGNNLEVAASVDDAFVWNVNVNSNDNGTYTVNLSSNSYYFNLSKNGSSANPNLSDKSETTQISKSSTNTSINAYKIHRTANPARFLNYNGTTFTGAQSTGAQNDWLFISQAQMTAYKKYIASETNIDMTFAIKNPGFENSTWNEGWTTVNFREMSGNAKFTGKFAEMYHHPDWGGGATSGSIKQTISNIPNGRYTVKAKATGGVGNDALFANSSKTLVPNTSDNVSEYIVEGYVVNGTITIGFERVNSEWWSAVDDFELFYNGPLTAEANEDVTSWCGSWTANQGNGPSSYGTGIETYGNNGTEIAFVEGKVISQNLEGIPNGYYEVQFYACANMAWQQWATGENIAEVYANDGAYGIEVIAQTGCTPADEANLQTLIAKVTDGKLSFGIKNIATGGNWYVVQMKSLTYLSDAAATMSVNNVAKYGTFCAPFDVTIPSGVSAYKVTDVNGNALVLDEVTTTIPANTPVILNAEGGLAATTFYGMAVDGTPTAGLLVGTYTQIDAPAGSYILYNGDNGVGFYRVGSDYAEGKWPKVSANRCYLTAPTQQAKMFSIGDGGATAIETVTALTEGKIKNIYNVNAAVRGGLQQGVNIVTLSNGKTVKVIVK